MSGPSTQLRSPQLTHEAAEDAIYTELLSQDAVDDAILHEYMRRKNMRAKSRDFLHYTAHVAPWFVIEEIHILIAEAFDDLAFGETDRLMLFLPPRAGKSELSSKLLPSWWEGLYPTDQVLHTSYAGTLVEKFGRMIRNLITTDSYQEIFPETQIAKDSKAAGQWATSKGGVYNAAGVGAGIAGKGFNLGLIDDPISEQDMYSRLVMDRVADWYSAGFYTRRQPERNKIVLVMTRWNVADLAGRLLESQLAEDSVDTGADVWKVIKVPALINAEVAEKLNKIARDPKYEKFLNTGKHPYPMTYKEGDSFSPRRWSKKELLRTKHNMTKKVWSALYMQEPTEEGGGIMPAANWRKWNNEFPPECDYKFQSYDTAFEETEKNDYTVRTTWGIFLRPEDNKFACILLERLRKRIAFPDLRENAVQAYRDYEPDKVLIEKRASGHSLIQELKRARLPILAISEKGSKLTKAHVASLMLEKGLVYYMPRNWAQEIIDECAAFPNGPHDDCVDSCGQAWLYFRRKFYLQLSEEDDNEEDFDGEAQGRYQRQFKTGTDD